MLLVEFSLPCLQIEPGEGERADVRKQRLDEGPLLVLDWKESTISHSDCTYGLSQLCKVHARLATSNDNYSLPIYYKALLQAVGPPPANRFVLVCSFLHERSSAVVCLLHVAHSPSNFWHDTGRTGQQTMLCTAFGFAASGSTKDLLFLQEPPSVCVFIPRTTHAYAP